MSRLPSIVCLVLVTVTGLGRLAAPPPAPPAASALPTSPAFTGTLSKSAVDLATQSGNWPATQTLLDTAINRLDRKCLAAQGFDDPTIDSPLPSPPEDEAAVIDLPGRRVHGYGLTLAATGPPPDSFYQHLSAPQRRRFDLALFGPPDARVSIHTGSGQTVQVGRQGCEADSRRVLMGDVSTWARVHYVSEEFNNQLADQVSDTPGYLKAMATWRSCMAQQGHTYDGPEAAQAAIRARYQDVGATAGFRREEIAVAVADGECATTAHLPATALRERRDLVVALPEGDRRTLADLAFYRDLAVARATALLGPGLLSVTQAAR